MPRIEIFEAFGYVVIGFLLVIIVMVPLHEFMHGVAIKNLGCNLTEKESLQLKEESGLIGYVKYSCPEGTAMWRHVLIVIAGSIPAILLGLLILKFVSDRFAALGGAILATGLLTLWWDLGLPPLYNSLQLLGVFSVCFSVGDWVV